MNKEASYIIRNNDDWNNLNQGEALVDINNDAYFGFRAMEKEAIEIMYDPCIIDSLVRVGKESKKFPLTAHNLILDIDTLGFDSSVSEENFLKDSSRTIENLLELNPDVKLNFTIKCGSLNQEVIMSTLERIYILKSI